MKTFEVIKNGTIHATIKADNLEEAENIYLSTYGELNAEIIEI